MLVERVPPADLGHREAPASRSFLPNWEGPKVTFSELFSTTEHSSHGNYRISAALPRLVPHPSKTSWTTCSLGLHNCSAESPASASIIPCRSLRCGCGRFRKIGRAHA